MTSTFNLPPGVLARDCDGEEMPRCEECGEEHNNFGDLCDDCKSNQEKENETEI